MEFPGVLFLGLKIYEGCNTIIVIIIIIIIITIIIIIIIIIAFVSQSNVMGLSQVIFTNIFTRGFIK